MKKFLPFVFSALLLIGCKKDDEIQVAVCEDPTNVQVSNRTESSADISWTDTNISRFYSVEFGPSGFIPGNGTTLNATSETISISGLSANTSYDVYVKTLCAIDNHSMLSAVSTFTTLPPAVNPQFTQNLSDMNLFLGDLSDLNPTIYAFEYEPSSSLFADYAHKQRIMALPQGTKLEYINDGLPSFPDDTVIAKTFYYNADETNPNSEKIIIETRVLIKQNGEWQSADYRWNATMTDATLDPEGGVVPITYVDEQGDTQNVNYKIPSNQDCFTCHGNAGSLTPIGPKLRNLNYDGQLDDIINNNYLDGLVDASTVDMVPKWDDLLASREQRARAYFDINCAHCHSAGGFCEDQSTLRLGWDIPFEQTNIADQTFSIQFRMQEYIEGFSMPFIGTTMVHQEGYELIESYLNSLD